MATAPSNAQQARKSALWRLLDGFLFTYSEPGSTLASTNVQDALDEIAQRRTPPAEKSTIVDDDEIRGLDSEGYFSFTRWKWSTLWSAIRERVLPSGGAAGRILAKASDADYSVEYRAPSIVQTYMPGVVTITPDGRLLFSSGGSVYAVEAQAVEAPPPGEVDRVLLLLHLTTDFSDSSAFGREPTRYFATIEPHADAAGFPQYAAQFNGRNAYVKYPSAAAPSFSADGFTIEARVCVPSGGSGPIVSTMTSDEGGFSLEVSSVGSIRMTWWLAGQVLKNHEPVAQLIEPGTYYNIAWQLSTTHAELYVDGVQVWSEDVDGTGISLSAPVFIGRRPSYLGGYSEFFKGWIKEVRITDHTMRYSGDYTNPTEPFPNP